MRACVSLTASVEQAILQAGRKIPFDRIELLPTVARDMLATFIEVSQ
jgi:hypothetical protein